MGYAIVFHGPTITTSDYLNKNITSFTQEQHSQWANGTSGKYGAVDLGGSVYFNGSTTSPGDQYVVIRNNGGWEASGVNNYVFHYADGTSVTVAATGSTATNLRNVTTNERVMIMKFQNQTAADDFATMWSSHQTNAAGSPMTTLDIRINTGGFSGWTFGGDIVPASLAVCFCAGTMILSDGCDIAIENLAIGDLVQTLNHGLKTVKWVGKSTLTVFPSIAPIVFKAGSIGNTSDLTVSPQHQVLITDWRAEVMFGTNEILVPAKKLVNGDTIYVDSSVTTVDYYHFALDQHEIVFANGAKAETLFIGVEALKTFNSEQRAELEAIFPELLEGVSFKPAAYVVSDPEATILRYM